MDGKRISIKWKYNLGLVCDTIQSILLVQRMLVSMLASEFQQWTEESKMELEPSFLMEWSNGFDFING